ncbi:MAG: penicillin-binding protein 2 [Rhodocyclaceae bacterium]|jgi:cell division protein FtsI (penicillin-binding protein 3)|nr:penicillin-binding protein 2 [Rhodocyclaceae bacterium]
MRLTRSPLLDERLPAWRARFILGLLLLGSAALVGRSFWLQGINKEFLIGKGESRYERVIEMPATRGRILDRNGDVLAISTPVKSVWAIPEDARLSPAQTRELAKLLDTDARELTRRLATERDFVYLKRRIAPDVAARIGELKLPGIHFQNEYRRYYPSGEVTSHMLGFTGAEDAGQEGIELAMNGQLSGKPGSRRVIKDRRGRIVEDVESIHVPQDGKDVALALDAKLQYLAYSQLRKALTDHKAKAGGIVVLDARTGEILALANLPTYNPNNRSKLSGAQLRNRAFTDTFEPGSTFKPFGVALALEQGHVRFDTQIQTAPGRLTINGATINDAHKHDLLSVAQIIQKSSNVGTAKIALGLRPEDMWRMFDKLGFGQPLKLGFPGEAAGRLRPWKRWRPIEQATMSYGHGISVTLIQLARAYLAFARDGDVLPLSFARLETAPSGGIRIFSQQTAREVRTMLEMAVQPGGTAPMAQVAGYRVAGKTGTAHKLEGGRYANKYISSFVGFAPASDPRLIVAVMIDEPTDGIYYGGAVAAPVFSRVMESALRSLGIPPDDTPRPLQMANAPPAKEDM